MTQKYDKVVWQDETTSQQGTLINAERLDQMQTAHHYADGFEEVDEVPTEDPGVDYHKVVYCTADTTFYRWNGEEWTKDVDDDTKALLLAHEADHNNPHVVTKAQVGLGNCDNTADLDKPISTATQTALDGKVTANAAITGATKTKITYDSKGLVTGGADLADSDIPSLAISKITGLQSALDNKLDDSQLKTSWSSPVSDANIPSEKLTKDTLDAKVDDTQIVATWSGTPTDTNIPSEKLVKTSLGDGSVTKVGTATVGGNLKPVYLNAGVPTAVANDFVDLPSAQTIAGVKTFTSNPVVSGTSPGLTLKNTDMDLNGDPSATKYNLTYIRDKNNIEVGSYGVRKYTSGLTQWYTYIKKNSVNTILALSLTDSSAYMTGPSRTYDAGNIDDVVTIRLLDGYTPMVRTTNAQTISGIKTFNDHIQAPVSVQNVPALIPRAAGTGWVKLYECTDTNHSNAIIAMMPRRATSTPGFGIIAVGGHNNGTVICKWMSKNLVNATYLNSIMVSIESDVITVWGSNISATDNVNMRIVSDVYNGTSATSTPGFKASRDTAIYMMTTDGGGNITGYVDSDSVTHTFIAYEISS